MMHRLFASTTKNIDVMSLTFSFPESHLSWLLLEIHCQILLFSYLFFKEKLSKVCNYPNTILCIDMMICKPVGR